MVKLTRIYTRTGDDGTTGLGTGARVLKTDPRVAAYGTVDEANAAVGVAIVECERAPAGPARAALGRIADLLRSIQHDLFDAGADLCVPVEAGAGQSKGVAARLRLAAAQTARLERAIDEYNEPLGTLTSFVLPGGSAASAALHLARTITRRAERETVALAQAQPGTTNPEVVKYLNRLSDLLFVLARSANDGGARDVLWKPGANR